MVVCVVEESLLVVLVLVVLALELIEFELFAVIELEDNGLLELKLELS